MADWWRDYFGDDFFDLHVDLFPEDLSRCGTQSLHTNSMDETYALPTEKIGGIALRTQQVIANETCVTATIDPLAGSRRRLTFPGRVLAGIDAGDIERS